MKACWIVAVLVCVTMNPVSAQDQPSPIEWSFTGELNLAPSVLDERPRIYDILSTSFQYNYDFFHLLADVSLRNDEKYSQERMDRLQD